MKSMKKNIKIMIEILQEVKQQKNIKDLKENTKIFGCNIC